MSVYIVAVYHHPTRESAEQAVKMYSPAHGCESADVEVVDAPPVVLSGLMKGGEIQTVDDWHPNMLDTLCVCVAADGRYVPDRLSAIEAAEARGALPITWYYYTKED
jgi:hypothetical protein